MKNRLRELHVPVMPWALQDALPAGLAQWSFFGGSVLQIQRTVRHLLLVPVVQLGAVHLNHTHATDVLRAHVIKRDVSGFDVLDRVRDLVGAEDVPVHLHLVGVGAVPVVG